MGTGSTVWPISTARPQGQPGSVKPLDSVDMLGFKPGLCLLLAGDDHFPPGQPAELTPLPGCVTSGQLPHFSACDPPSVN